MADINNVERTYANKDHYDFEGGEYNDAEVVDAMKSKDVVYKNIMSELNPLWEELYKIETELNLMWKFNHDSELDRKHKDKLNERATYLRREIAWWESELEEVS
jgi:hypothetical protein